jgi:hypothetical protein
MKISVTSESLYRNDEPDGLRVDIDGESITIRTDDSTRIYLDQAEFDFVAKQVEAYRQASALLGKAVEDVI